jgi:hypothetical protein
MADTDLIRIEHLWAAVAVDELGEGIVSYFAPDGARIMLIAIDDTIHLNWMREQAKAIAEHKGILIRIIHFGPRTEHEAFDGRQG